VDADSPLRGDLVEIKKAADQATSLTRQLLAFSRKQLAVRRVLDLREIVADMDNMLRRLLGEDVELVTVTDPSLGHVKADRSQIEQVLMNLVVNARDAMPAGGTLTIEDENVDLDAETCEGLGIAPGHYVKLAVSDTGTGIDAGTRARIFEPFFTTKEKGRGTGLGLSTVYGIVKQSGGYIKVDSEPGNGASFTIWLPRVDEAISPRDLRSARPLGGKETILLVEDEQSVRGLVRTVLARQGYRVLEASNGQEAIRIATSTDEAIDLVLTDAVMPGMTVSRLIADLRDVRPHAKTLIMSGYTSEAMARRGILESDIPFIPKPFTGNILLSKIREVLGAT
jgi:CheY-like chemotaxis protein